MFRTSLIRSTRAFSTVRPLQKGPVEMGKDALKTVDQAASKAAIKGLDAGVNTVKETASKVAGQTEQATGQVKGDAAEMAGQAKGKAYEMAGKAQGKANEIDGKIKGAAQ